MTAGLCGAFLLSGAAALLFEALWFRLAGLALGNSVWASSTVLAAFMAGLAFGNAVAVRYAGRVRRPLRLYAALELGVALGGALLVLILPALAEALAPLFGRIRHMPWAVNGLRLGVAFGLMAIPAAAMGTTLPLLASTLSRTGGGFGVALGLLYGWNTLGGVAGALACELLLVPHLGLRATAGVAGMLNLGAAALALLLERRGLARGMAEEAGRREAADDGGSRRSLLAAALLAGGLLLGLEVVWFRFLQLFVFATQSVFAVMLATILAGIGLGGLIAAAWLRRRGPSPELPPLVALGCGFATLLTYIAFDPGAVTVPAADMLRAFVLAPLLMLPTAVASGVLFTLIGSEIRQATRGDAEAAGRLALANTVGAALGAPLAGLFLLPRLGVEASLFALGLGYLAVAFLARPRVEPAGGRRRLIWSAGLAAFLGLVVFFPHGLMYGRFLRVPLAGQLRENARLLAVREGTVDTALLVRRSWGGEPLWDVLQTNAYSMSSSTFYGRRYMKLFAYWPLALRPDARRALLISYGIGNTAEALARAPGLTRIDVVDISNAVFELSPLVWRQGWPDPLSDPRLVRHLEDGRFHLLAGGERYDIVTAEPPPPRGAGVVSLYTREYFGLVRRRLLSGGIATHWLPVNQLSHADACGIATAFCEAFQDCTLWAGAGHDWMLAGTNGAGAPAQAAFSALWHAGPTAADLVDLGIESPAQLGSLYLADRDRLRTWCEGMPPITDDRPGRLSQRAPEASEQAAHARFMDARATVVSFRSSPVIRRLWPADLREQAPAWFPLQGIWNADFDQPLRPLALAELWAVLEDTSLRTLPLLLADSEPRLRSIARARRASGDEHPMLAFHLGVAALADHDYAAAGDLFRRAGRQSGSVFPAPLLRALALALGGQLAEAEVVASGLPAEAGSPLAEWKRWLLLKLRSRRDAVRGSRAE